MNNSFYPCIWFNNNGREAVDYYATIFDSVKIVSENPIVVYFEINGVRFMALNGGDFFRPTPAVSYFVYCNNDPEKTERIYNQLKEGGKVMMPLDKYDWSEKYAWIEDKFGVSWQIDIDAINNPQSIVPALLFVNNKRAVVQEAVDYYISVFKNGKKIMSFPEKNENTPADVYEIFSQFSINNFIINAMSGGEALHNFDFTEGNSFTVNCDTQEEIDYYWNTLTNGGKESMCGWLHDKYGVWWQIIPSILGELIGNPQTGQNVNAAMMKMKKMDIETLKKAANTQ